MTTFQFNPSRIQDRDLRDFAIYWHYRAKERVEAPPSPLRAVEGERSDELGDGVAGSFRDSSI